MHILICFLTPPRPNSKLNTKNSKLSSRSGINQMRQGAKAKIKFFNIFLLFFTKRLNAKHPQLTCRIFDQMRKFALLRGTPALWDAPFAISPGRPPAPPANEPKASNPSLKKPCFLKHYISIYAYTNMPVSLHKPSF